jgi:hypothetical protein
VFEAPTLTRLPWCHTWLLAPLTRTQAAPHQTRCADSQLQAYGEYDVTPPSPRGSAHGSVLAAAPNALLRPCIGWMPCKGGTHARDCDGRRRCGHADVPPSGPCGESESRLARRLVLHVRSIGKVRTCEYHLPKSSSRLVCSPSCVSFFFSCFEAISEAEHRTE